jgi:AraC-like DNA-binding protein
MAHQTQNKYAEIIWTVTEEKYFKDEVAAPFHCFVRLISGEMKVMMADRTYHFNAGDTFLFPRNKVAMVIKQGKNGVPYKALTVALNIDRLKKYYTDNNPLAIDPPLDFVRVFGKHPMLDSFFLSMMPYYDLRDKLPDRITFLKIEEAISILRALDPHVDAVLADFSEPGKVQLADFMEQHYMFNLPLEKFGYLTGRSLATFRRDFKKTFYNTPQKWLMQKRLELAHYQLSEKNKQPVEVYLEVGFENLSHFSYAFKKHYGYAPSVLVSERGEG